jgi:hypothetical protein
MIIFLKKAYENSDEKNLNDTETNTLFHHRFIEASKFAFGFRELVTDDNIIDCTQVYFKTRFDQFVNKKFALIF